MPVREVGFEPGESCASNTKGGCEAYDECVKGSAAEVKKDEDNRRYLVTVTRAISVLCFD